MAIQLFAYAESKGYDVKLYADTTAVAYTPFEFTVADWKVTYDSQDIYRPGIVSSRMEISAPITQGEYSQNLEAILQDGDGTFYMELSKNLGDIWKGYCVPSAGSVEVINGQRFISIIAGDGFQLLNMASDGYTFTGVKPFTTQIADIFNRVQMFRLFNGFLVSKDLTRMYASSNDYDTLYLTGTKHEGVYNTGTTFYSFKEVIEGICAAFGLRMYQDNGYIVFQDFTRPESSFNVYNTDGSYQTNIDYTGTQELTVISGGTKMYQPPLRITNLQYLLPSEPYENYQDQYQETKHTVWLDPFNYEVRNWTDLGTFFCDGVSHIDYDLTLKILYTIPAGFNDRIDWTIKVYFWLGEYSTDGTATWTTPSGAYVEINQHQNLSGDPEPTPGSLVYNTTNSHLPTVPNIGEVSFGITVEASYVSTGAELEDVQPVEAKWDIVQHGATSPYRGFRADNSRRKLGEDVTYTTRIGDRGQTGFPNDQQIVYVGPLQNLSVWPSQWLELLPGGTNNANSLLQITANRIAQRRAVPLEYYELDLHETSSVTHLGSWGGVDYFPVNIEYNYEGSRVTYAKIVNLPLEADPLRYDTEL